MSEIKIDKGIPIPSKGKYPWDKMEVGDSFYMDTPSQRASGTLSHANRKWSDRKWIARKEGTGSRIWRVE